MAKTFQDCCSGTNLSVCLLLRNYSTDIVIKENHATGHSICLPSSGPTEAAKALPCIDDTWIPLLTFLGPDDKWTTVTCRGSFRMFYEVDPKLDYEALHIWIRIGNKAFQRIKIDDSKEKLVQV